MIKCLCLWRVCLGEEGKWLVHRPSETSRDRAQPGCYSASAPWNRRGMSDTARKSCASCVCLLVGSTFLELQPMISLFPKFKKTKNKKQLFPLSSVSTFFLKGNSKHQKPKHDITLPSPPSPSRSRKEHWEGTQEGLSLFSRFYF